MWTCKKPTPAVNAPLLTAEQRDEKQRQNVKNE
jgi:hypothetical protein